MPSQPNRNSPFMDSRLQAALGVRAPGTPTSAGKPGPQAANLSFPAPPSPAAAPPGRPGAPTGPQPPLPVLPTAGARPTPPGPPQPPTQPTRPPQSSPQPAQEAAPRGGPPSAQPPTPVNPLGTPTIDEVTGEVRTTLSPEGDLRYREAVLRGREALGPLPRIFRNPGLPQMPFELGRWNYNPFTSGWHK